MDRVIQTPVALPCALAPTHTADPQAMDDASRHREQIEMRESMRASSTRPTRISRAIQGRQSAHFGTNEKRAASGRG